MNLLKYFKDAANLVYAPYASEPFVFEDSGLSIEENLLSPGRLSVLKGAEYGVFEPPADNPRTGICGSIVVFRHPDAGKAFYFVPGMKAADVEVNLKAEGSVPAYPGMPHEVLKNYERHIVYIAQNIDSFIETGRLRLNVIPMEDMRRLKNERFSTHFEISG